MLEDIVGSHLIFGVSLEHSGDQILSLRGEDLHLHLCVSIFANGQHEFVGMYLRVYI